jgi:putative oxidoreductase
MQTIIRTRSNSSASNAFRADLGLLALRLVLGVVFLFHGSQKLFGWFGGYGIDGTAGFMESIDLPFPVASAVLSGAVELLGGLALATGIGQRLLSVPLAFTMLVASFMAHGGAFAAGNGGMEFTLTLAVASAALGLTGPGRFALRFRLSEALEPVRA